LTTFYTALCEALRAASSYNAVDQSPPVAVLWPDKERQWEALLPRLQADLPVVALGPFDPATRTGPAIWLRCLVDRTLPAADWPTTTTPILYLPGVGKQELRAIEDAPKLLQPLAELQYRGVLWTQKNGKDWTIAAFLQSADKGLNIEIGGDNATREAMQRALLKLADEPIEELRKDAPLTASRFNALLNPDQVRSLLLWMDQPTTLRAKLGEAEWSAFRADCKQQYGFDPEADGEITAAAYLGLRIPLFTFLAAKRISQEIVNDWLMPQEYNLRNVDLLIECGRRAPPRRRALPRNFAGPGIRGMRTVTGNIARALFVMML
jgi:hypothetical protein